jgi:thiol-disulfide isomerase/thioredoxin
MSNSKIVSLKKYKTSQKWRRWKNKILDNPFKILSKTFRENKRMFFIVIIISIFLGSFLWNSFVENPARLDVKIPQSNNITFNDDKPLAMTTAQIANEFENFEGKPILLYIYTTWCPSCAKQTPVINEIAREFQNTDLRVITLAVDKGLGEEELKKHLSHLGELYFQPRYLSYKEGFVGFLKKKNISYQGRIPYTIFISQYGDIVTKYVGSKSHNYLRNKIIKEIF